MNKPLREGVKNLECPMLDVGEKIHVVMRRVFTDDVRRHFAGTVTALAGTIIRAEGYSFEFNPVTLHHAFKPDMRTHIFGVGESREIINVIPKASVLERMRYEVVDGRHVVTDGALLHLDINEFEAVS